MPSYAVCGLLLRSEIPLLGVTERSDNQTPPEVVIRNGPVPTRLEDARASGPSWDMAGDRFLLRIPGVARFLLVGGRDIVFEAESGLDAQDISIFILGTVLGILLHQRGQIVLHASGICVNGRAVLFCGPAGAGKSTLAAAFAQNGFACVTDDVCAITLSDQDGPAVHPDGRQLKLWDQAIKQLQLSDYAGDRVRKQLEKYYVGHAVMVTESVPLGAVYVLREARPPFVPGIERPNVVDCLLLLRRSAYRPRLVSQMGQRDAYFHAASAIANVAGVYRLTRTLDFAAIPDTISQLERHWSDIGLIGTGASDEKVGRTAASAEPSDRTARTALGANQ